MHKSFVMSLWSIFCILLELDSLWSPFTFIALQKSTGTFYKMSYLVFHIIMFTNLHLRCSHPFLILPVFDFSSLLNPCFCLRKRLAPFSSESEFCLLYLPRCHELQKNKHDSSVMQDANLNDAQGEQQHLAQYAEAVRSWKH